MHSDSVVNMCNQHLENSNDRSTPFSDGSQLYNSNNMDIQVPTTLYQTTPPRPLNDQGRPQGDPGRPLGDPGRPLSDSGFGIF